MDKAFALRQYSLFVSCGVSDVLAPCASLSPYLCLYFFCTSSTHGNTVQVHCIFSDAGASLVFPLVSFLPLDSPSFVIHTLKKHLIQVDLLLTWTFPECIPSVTYGRTQKGFPEPKLSLFLKFAESYFCSRNC